MADCTKERNKEVIIEKLAEFHTLDDLAMFGEKDTKGGNIDEETRHCGYFTFSNKALAYGSQPPGRSISLSSKLKKTCSAP
jgi:hypothetical protein